MKMGISLHRSPTGEPARGLIYRGLGKDGGGLWKRSISNCENSIRGTWREGSFTGYPEGYDK